MEVKFKHHDQCDSFEDEGRRNLILKITQFLEVSILKLYPSVSSEKLESINLLFIDSTAAEVGSSCTQNIYDPSSFLIKISFESGHDIVEIIAHELCHVLQHISGKMSSIGDSKEIIKWEGREFNINNIEHSQRPWEIEAMMNAIQLHSLYYSRRAI